MTCIVAHDPQLARLADAIAVRVGPQRFHVWFNNSTRLDLKQDGLEIAVPNDFISEWINKNFTKPIQDAALEVLGGPLAVRYNVMPQLFDAVTGGGREGQAREAHATVNERATMNERATASHLNGSGSRDASRTPDVSRVPVEPSAEERARGARVGTPGSETTRVTRPVTHRGNIAPVMREVPTQRDPGAMSKPTQGSSPSRLRHELESYVVGPSNQLAYNTAIYVAEFPGAQYNPLFIHGPCGLGKTHLLQGLCKRFIRHHPTKRWAYMTGEEFTNEFLTALRANKVDVFRRKMRDLDLLVIDDVHFLGGKKATQEEFLHTFNAIEAMGKQVVLASDEHPKMIGEFGESLINRFVSGMVVRVDPPNFLTRCEILRSLSGRVGLILSEEVINWVARRVTQNVRELEGAITRIAAYVKLTGRAPDVQMAQESLGDLDRQHVAPVKPESILQAVCQYFGLEMKDLMSGRRQRTISLARSISMYLVRKTAKLSYPEIGTRMGKRNHSTVISACRRIERATSRNEKLDWTSAVGDREEEAVELIQRLEDMARVLN